MSDDQDTLLTFDPDEVGQRPYLKVAGKYGHGMEHAAAITVGRVVPRVDKSAPNCPDFIREDKCEFAEITFEVVSEEFGKTLLFHNVRHGKELNELALALGVEPTITETTDPSGRTRRSATLNIRDLANRPVGCLEVGEPVASKKQAGLFYNGRIKSVVGV